MPPGASRILGSATRTLSTRARLRTPSNRGAARADARSPAAGIGRTRRRRLATALDRARERARRLLHAQARARSAFRSGSSRRCDRGGGTWRATADPALRIPASALALHVCRKQPLQKRILVGGEVLRLGHGWFVARSVTHECVKDLAALALIVVRAYALNMTTKRRKGVPVTEGLRKLRELARARTQADVARELGVSQQTVSAYLRRHARPDSETRDRGEIRLGIPRLDWYTPEEAAVARGEPLSAA